MGSLLQQQNTTTQIANVVQLEEKCAITLPPSEAQIIVGAVGKLGTLGAELVNSSDMKDILSLCQVVNNQIAYWINLDVIIDGLKTASEQAEGQKKRV